MNYRNFIRGLLVTTILFGGVVLFMTFFVSPEANMVSVILYILSTGIFIFGIATILGFYIRRWWMHNEVLLSNVKLAVRQGALVAVFSMALLILSAMRLLTWWDAIILAVSFLLIELYFKSRI